MVARASRANPPTGAPASPIKVLPCAVALAAVAVYAIQSLFGRRVMA